MGLQPFILLSGDHILRSAAPRFPTPSVPSQRCGRSLREPARAIRAAVLPLVLTTALAGCVPQEEFTQAASDRDLWRKNARVLEKENKKLRDVLDQWIRAHNALQAQVNKLSAPGPLVIPTVTKEELASLRARLQRYEDDIATLENKNQTLEQDRNAFRNWYNVYKQRYQKAVLREQRLQRKSKVYARMVRNLETEVDQGKLKLQEVEGRLTVSVIDKIVFDPGGVEINPEGRKVLKKLADLLKGLSGKRIQVEGHTDNLPVRPRADRRYRNNWELSTLRAAAVVRYLQTAGGVDPALLSAVGHGPFQPIASNKTPEGRRKNRRIEIVLTPLPKKSVGRNSSAKPAAQPIKPKTQ